MTALGWVMYSGGATKLGGWTLVLGVAILVFRFWGGRLSARASFGHSHGGTPEKILNHEGAHVTGAKATGNFRKARVWRDGGVVTLKDPDKMSPAEYMAFMKAGEVAVGSGEGCSADRAAVREEVRRLKRQGVTPKDIRREVSESNRLAKKWAASPDVSKWAGKLGEKGKL